MLSEDLTKFIGRKSTPVVMEVSRVDIRKICDAAGNRDPLYWDDDFARTTSYGGMIAPPDFFGWPVTWAPDGVFVIANDNFGDFMSEVVKAGYYRAINAGAESDYLLPVRPGDRLVATAELISLTEKEGKTGGKMLLSVTETTFINQDGKTVARQRWTLIH